ncbi:MAG: AraC family transcriptional regulator [Lewinellaceae bacterium]|nr:AraC family transcriptional regulator [Saprospiraceae bacterium]MCB9341533.1 AraC family transcriptional regulator [Lewinellaceae bacterium]
MQYQEFQPAALFSQHIECYWELRLLPNDLERRFEILAPDCTYEILLADHPFFITNFNKKQRERVGRGASLAGQKTTGFCFGVDRPTTIFGIRFKPFAFANLISNPLSQFNDKVLPLDKVFSISNEREQAIRALLTLDDAMEKVEAAEPLVSDLLEKSFPVDQDLRAQLNYILDRKGLVRIQDMFSEFGVSKVTLHNRFIQKIGLSPKKISRIWRMNYFLQLAKNAPEKNLTELGLEAGFYDQAHFIKECRSFFGDCPRRILQQQSRMVGISQQIIERRFSNQYDPR